MAGTGRPYKEGVEGLYLDCDFHRDVKVAQLCIKYKSLGKDVYLSLLSHIYENYGYFMPATDDELSMIAINYCQVPFDDFFPVLKYCIQLNLFDKEIYERTGILTAASIQNRFLKLVSNRNTIRIIKDFSLFDHEMAFKKRGRGQFCGLDLKETLFYRIYSEKAPLFIDGLLNPRWREVPDLQSVYTGEFVEVDELRSQYQNDPAYQKREALKELNDPEYRKRQELKRQMAAEKKAQEEQQEAALNAKVIGMGGNGGKPVGKAPMPAGFDFEREKKLVLENLEYKAWVMNALHIDEAEYNDFLNEYFAHQFAKENWQYAKRMQEHFIDWYPFAKNRRRLSGGKEEKLPNWKDAGKGNYSNTWKK